MWRSTKIGIGHIAKFSKKGGEFGEMLRWCQEHIGRVTLCLVHSHGHVCVSFLKSFFYAIRNSDFSVISYEVSKAIIALYFGR